jgi:hypothetical protein
MAQTAPKPPQSGSDWTVEAADRIEAVVTIVRDKTTVPAQQVAQAVVFGLFAAIMGIVALVLLVIGILRLNVYLPFGSDAARKMWVAYLIVGAILLLAGLFLFRKRTATRKE